MLGKRCQNTESNGVSYLLWTCPSGAWKEATSPDLCPQAGAQDFQRSIWSSPWTSWTRKKPLKQLTPTGNVNRTDQAKLGKLPANAEKRKGRKMWKARDLTSFKSDLMFLQATPRPYEEMPAEEKFQACYFYLNCWNSMDIISVLEQTSVSKAH